MGLLSTLLSLSKMAGSMRVIIPRGVTAASASFDGVRVGAGSASSSNRDCSVSLSVLRYA